MAETRKGLCKKNAAAHGAHGRPEEARLCQPRGPSWRLCWTRGPEAPSEMARSSRSGDPCPVPRSKRGDDMPQRNRFQVAISVLSSLVIQNQRLTGARTSRHPLAGRGAAAHAHLASICRACRTTSTRFVLLVKLEWS